MTDFEEGMYVFYGALLLVLGLVTAIVLLLQALR